MATDFLEDNDYYSPWKEALELYFPQFMELLFPFAYAKHIGQLPTSF